MSRKLIDGLKPEKSPLSYADHHHEITKNEAGDSLKPFGSQQKQATYRRASEEDELVKYMSSLPGFLERGEKIPEKFLNVGVLDWASLEQWQYSQKHVPHGSNQNLMSSSNTSSSVPTEDLSGNSSRGLNWSYSHQRIIHPSLQSHFRASRMQDHSIAVKSSGGSVGNCQNLRGSHNNIDRHRKYVWTGDHLSQNHPASILKGCHRKYLHPHINKETDILPNDRTYEAASCSKQERSTLDGRMEKKVESLREQNIDTDEQYMLGRSKPIVLILPRDIPQNSHCGALDMQTSLDQKLGCPSETRFSVKAKEPSCRCPNCNISHPCSLPDELHESRSQPKESGSNSIDSESFKIPGSTLPAPVPVRMRMSPCKSRKAEERKHTIAVSSSANRLDEFHESLSQPKVSGSNSIDSESFKIPGSTLPAPVPVRMRMNPCKSRKAEERKHTIAVSSSANRPDELHESLSQPKVSGSNSIDSESFKIPGSTLPAPIPVRMRMSPCKSRKAEERKHTIAVSSSANWPPKELDQKVTTEKSRSSSPFRRFSFSMGFTSKVSGCKEVAHVPHQSSVVALKSSSENVRGYASSNVSGNDKPGNAGKSRSSPLRRFLDPLVKPKEANYCHHSTELSQKDLENARGYTSSNISGNKSGDAGKSRSSPLRRLLDPLLKSKAASCHHSMNSFQKDSVLTNKNCRSGNGQLSTPLPEKELDRDQRLGCSTVNTADSSNDKRYAPTISQAVLRIAVKNDQPLFTFAVDNNSNILAATLKNLTVSRQDECNCMYTFFTFREVKKKNGSWMNNAGKSKGPDYVRHVIAQMKVSELRYDDSNSQNRVDSSIAKEFVLFSVKLKQGDAQVTHYQPNDELAAIIVKSPKAINAHQSSCQNEYQCLPHVTVVLPSGVHSLPSNGGPSSLIERWKTGGSCDCGGWDLACKLKIFANKNRACRKSRTSKAYFSDQYELFLQGNDQEQENRPAFIFSTFEPGVYSVAFDSSLSLLRAFSICIALVDGKLPYELSGSRNCIEGKNPRETLLVQTDEPKTRDKIEDIPGSYVAYPPVSPVGRV